MVYVLLSQKELATDHRIDGEHGQRSVWIAAHKYETLCWLPLFFVYISN